MVWSEQSSFGHFAEYGAAAFETRAAGKALSLVARADSLLEWVLEALVFSRVDLEIRECEVGERTEAERRCDVIRVLIPGDGRGFGEGRYVGCGDLWGDGCFGC